ncbi:MAG TPA: hypothetical protein VGP82_12280, partial [Ktedonobacterales bacterium]|nr:hypothetical protein [Ktedonobacterales bacterium]
MAVLLFVSVCAAAEYAAAVQRDAALSALSGAPAPGTRIQQGACEPPPPQSVKDRATYSAAELARYGLPPRTAAEPFEKWARIVRAVKTRGCGSSDTSSISRTQQIRHSEWAGNYANQPAPGKFYIEADTDFSIPSISAAPADLTNKDDFSAWVGLGGAYIDGSKNVVPSDYLIQTGIDAFYNENNLGGQGGSTGGGT